MEGQGIDDRWLGEQPSPMPSDVVRALEQMGNQVHQQRRLVPFRLEDGRKVVVPVDQVDVQPVNIQGFSIIPLRYGSIEGTVMGWAIRRDAESGGMAGADGAGARPATGHCHRRESADEPDCEAVAS